MNCIHFNIFSFFLLSILHLSSAFPLAARTHRLKIDQFIFEPVPGGSASNNVPYSSTFTIPSSYNTSFSREVVIAGIKLKQKSHLRYTLTLIAPSTDTTQTV